jgi:hypothetical protein
MQSAGICEADIICASALLQKQVKFRISQQPNLLDAVVKCKLREGEVVSDAASFVARELTQKSHKANTTFYISF